VTYSIPNYLNGDVSYEINPSGGPVRTIKKLTELQPPAENFVFLEESDPRGLNINSWVMELVNERWI
jgi:hypothetical protein